MDKGLLFYGDAGVGKTHLAVALMKEAIVRKGARAVFYEIRELLKLVRDTYSGSTEMSELDVLRPVLEAELLVLDDLGAEKKSEWVDETLGLVINTRYSERRLTVFTTNLRDVENTEPGSFAYHLGLRTRSRLKEMCDWMPIEGVDTREVGPYPTHEDIAEWQERSPGSPKNRRGSSLPPKVQQPGEGPAQKARERRQGRPEMARGPRRIAVGACSAFTFTSRSVRRSATTATSTAACSTATSSTRYLDALLTEIGRKADGSPADTIFFGGGTPSLLEPSEVQQRHRGVPRRPSRWRPAPRSRSRPTRRRSPAIGCGRFARQASIASVSVSNPFGTRNSIV